MVTQDNISWLLWFTIGNPFGIWYSYHSLYLRLLRHDIQLLMRLPIFEQQEYSNPSLQHHTQCYPSSQLLNFNSQNGLDICNIYSFHLSSKIQATSWSAREKSKYNLDVRKAPNLEPCSEEALVKPFIPATLDYLRTLIRKVFLNKRR